MANPAELGFLQRFLNERQATLQTACLPIPPLLRTNRIEQATIFAQKVIDALSPHMQGGIIQTLHPLKGWIEVQQSVEELLAGELAGVFKEVTVGETTTNISEISLFIKQFPSRRVLGKELAPLWVADLLVGKTTKLGDGVVAYNSDTNTWNPNQIKAVRNNDSHVHLRELRRS